MITSYCNCRFHLPVYIYLLSDFVCLFIDRRRLLYLLISFALLYLPIDVVYRSGFNLLRGATLPFDFVCLSLSIYQLISFLFLTDRTKVHSCFVCLSVSIYPLTSIPFLTDHKLIYLLPLFFCLYPSVS